MVEGTQRGDSDAESQGDASLTSAPVNAWAPPSPVAVQPTRSMGSGRRMVIQMGGLAVLALLTIAAFTVPVPWVVESPGPTFDVIGSSQGTPFIDISEAGTTSEGSSTDAQSGQGSDLRGEEGRGSGEEAQSTSAAPPLPDRSTQPPLTLDPVRDGEDGSGQLRMVTVSENGGPGSRLTLAGLIGAWFDERSEILPYDQVYPADVSADEIRRYATAQMTNSQSTAGVAALEELGWTVPATVTVAGPVPGSDAEGKLEEGDVLVSLTTPDGVVHPVDSASVPFAVMRTQPVGSTITVTFRRGGTERNVEVVSGSGDEGARGSKLGIYLVANVAMPLDVKVHLESVGGPSAGMMFALGIIDRLTPGDMTGGAVIAGTGALAYDGEVEPIGGIRQKMWGALRDGAGWFLAPAQNCAEVVGHVPDGLEVRAVGTLEEARGAVEAIAGGEGNSLPTCEAVLADSK